MPKLVIFRGDAVENEIRLARNTVRIGRHSNNDVVLDDGLNGVSRFHAEIRADGGTYSIVDVNSRNGVWINGRRIKEKAVLALGVPVTVGAFELALEDDISSADFNEPTTGHTVVNATSTDRKDASARSGVRSKPAGPAAARRPVVLWSAVAAIVLLICAVTFGLIRYMTAPAAPVEEVAALDPSPALTGTDIELPLSGLVVDPTAGQNEKDLADARALMAAGQNAAALRDHLQPLLERDPENADALELKRAADQAIAAAQTQRAARGPQPAPPTVNEVETPGIARRPNEVFADYQARAKRVLTAFAEGKASLDKQEYPAALAHFRAVHADQPKYNGVDVIYSEAFRQQQKALEEAIGNGQQGEQGGRLRLAREWYLRALDIDPTSTSAREKHASILGRMNAEATKLFNAGTFAQKSNEPRTATQKFQEVVDLMLPGDEIRARAIKELEGLKR